MPLLAKLHDEITSRFRGLPDAQQVASFNFIDQAVILRTVELSHIHRVSAMANTEQRLPLHLEIWGNTHHEYRHWADMTTSVFGLEWVLQMAATVPASNDQLQNPDEAFREACRNTTKRLAGIHLPEYYSVVENNIGRPWQYSSTVGRAFAVDGSVNVNHPLWFVRFASVDNVPIARQPISVASLLELRAVNTEMLFGYGVISQIPDAGLRAVSEAELTRSMFERLYTPHLTVYTAAAHWFANHRGVADYAAVSISASELAWFCLDAPSEWLTHLHATARFTEVYGAEFGHLMTCSLHRGDRGALFFMLGSDQRVKTGSAIEDLNALLQQEWGCTFHDVATQSRAEKQALLARLRQLKATEQLAQIWGHNVDLMTPGRELSLSEAGIKLPAVILADDTPLNVYRMTWGDDAFDARVFDPRPHFDQFMHAEIALSRYGMYSDQGMQCFSDL